MKSETGRNELFYDLQKKTTFTREELVARIQAGQYPGCSVKVIRGLETSVSKHDKRITKVQDLFFGPYYLDQILDEPEQWVAIGWVNGTLYSVIYEEREDRDGAYLHLVTLWKSTKAERKKYEEHS